MSLALLSPRHTLRLVPESAIPCGSGYACLIAPCAGTFCGTHRTFTRPVAPQFGNTGMPPDPRRATWLGKVPTLAVGRAS